MADDFSRLFPPSIARMQWPLTYEKDNTTQIRREALRPHVPDSRQQLVNFINDQIYEGGREGNRYAENAATLLDFPLGLGHGVYDTARGAVEGRFGDSVISLAMALPPPPIKKVGKKVVQSVKDIFRTRGRTIPDARPEHVSDSRSDYPDVTTERERKITPSRPESATPPITQSNFNIVAPNKQLILPETSLVVPRPHIIRPVSRDALEAKRGEAFNPTFLPYSPDWREPEIEFTLPRHWKQRSSPWVAQYPPMTLRRRPFRLDYPKDPPTNAQGRLLFDIEGRPLTARNIAGRNEVGKSDRALESNEMVRIIKNDLGLTLASRSKDHLIPGAIGQLSINATDGRLAEIVVWNKLPADQESVTIAHELGHVFDLIAGQLSMQRFDDELIPLYSAHSTGRIGPPYLLPEGRGYPPHMSPRERAAEAFRIYTTGANTMKSMAPKAAAAMRELNDHPFFSEVIQFNGLPFGIPTGAAAATAAALGIMANSDEANAGLVGQALETPPRGFYEKTSADRGLVNISNALARSNGDAQPRNEEKLRELIDTRMRRQPRLQSYGGPR